MRAIGNWLRERRHNSWMIFYYEWFLTCFKEMPGQLVQQSLDSSWLFAMDAMLHAKVVIEIDDLRIFKVNWELLLDSLLKTLHKVNFSPRFSQINLGLRVGRGYNSGAINILRDLSDEGVREFDQPIIILISPVELTTGKLWIVRLIYALIPITFSDLTNLVYSPY